MVVSQSLTGACAVGSVVIGQGLVARKLMHVIAMMRVNRGFG